MKSTAFFAFAALAAAQSAAAGPLFGRQLMGTTSKPPSFPFFNAEVSDSSSSSASTTESPSSSSISSSTTDSSSSLLSSSAISSSESTTASSTATSESESSTESSSTEMVTFTDMTSTFTTDVEMATATATPSSVPNVTEILQLALTLEHLESTFYSQGLANFTIEDFNNAGLPTWAYGRFEQIAEHEAKHVEFLTSVLGNDAVAACNYSFPGTTPWDFVALSEVLEGVGEAAYIGAGTLLASNPEALTAGAAIIPVEARHASWVQSVLYSGDPWNSAFDTPISANLAYTLASTFITACPAANPSLPFKAFPALNITDLTQPDMLTNGSTYAPTAGQNVTFAYDNSTANGAIQYVAFLSGLNTTFAPIDSNKTATIPSDFQGLVFAVITTNNSVLSEDFIIAGPATLDFMLGSNATALY